MSVFRFSVIISSLLMAISCQSKKLVKRNIENGVLVSEIWLQQDKLIYKEYDSLGRITSGGNIDNNGDKYGYWRFYNENRTVKCAGEFVKDYRVGGWLYNFRDSSYTLTWETWEKGDLKISVPRTWRVVEDTILNMPLFGSSNEMNPRINFNVFVYNDVKSSINEFLDIQVGKYVSTTLFSLTAKNSHNIKRRTIR
jgi:hypothetical protein